MAQSNSYQNFLEFIESEFIEKQEQYGSSSVFSLLKELSVVTSEALENLSDQLSQLTDADKGTKNILTTHHSILVKLAHTVDSQNQQLASQAAEIRLIKEALNSMQG